MFYTSYSPNAPSNVIEKKSYRWRIEFVSRNKKYSKIELFATKVKKPSFKVETLTKKLNYTYNINFTKTVSWNPIDITFADFRYNAEASNNKDLQLSASKNTKNPEAERFLSKDEKQTIATVKDLMLENIKKSNSEYSYTSYTNVVDGKVLKKLSEIYSLKPIAADDKNNPPKEQISSNTMISPQALFTFFLISQYGLNEYDIESNNIYKSFYKKDSSIDQIRIYELDPLGRPLESWTLFNPIITSFDPGTLDYSTDSLMNVNIGLIYDFADFKTYDYAKSVDGDVKPAANPEGTSNYRGSSDAVAERMKLSSNEKDASFSKAVEAFNKEKNKTKEVAPAEPTPPAPAVVAAEPVPPQKRVIIALNGLEAGGGEFVVDPKDPRLQKFKATLVGQPDGYEVVLGGKRGTQYTQREIRDLIAKAKAQYGPNADITLLGFSASGGDALKAVLADKSGEVVGEKGAAKLLLVDPFVGSDIDPTKLTDAQKKAIFLYTNNGNAVGKLGQTELNAENRLASVLGGGNVKDTNASIDRKAPSKNPAASRKVHLKQPELAFDDEEVLKFLGTTKEELRALKKEADSTTVQNSGLLALLSNPENADAAAIAFKEPIQSFKDRVNNALRKSTTETVEETGLQPRETVVPSTPDLSLKSVVSPIDSAKTPDVRPPETPAASTQSIVSQVPPAMAAAPEEPLIAELDGMIDSAKLLPVQRETLKADIRAQSRGGATGDTLRRNLTMLIQTNEKTAESVREEERAQTEAPSATPVPVRTEVEVLGSSNSSSSSLKVDGGTLTVTSETVSQTSVRTTFTDYSKSTVQQILESKLPEKTFWHKVLTAVHLEEEDPVANGLRADQIRGLSQKIATKGVPLDEKIAAATALLEDSKRSGKNFYPDDAVPKGYGASAADFGGLRAGVTLAKLKTQQAKEQGLIGVSYEYDSFAENPEVKQVVDNPLFNLNIHGGKNMPVAFEYGGDSKTWDKLDVPRLNENIFGQSFRSAILDTNPSVTEEYDRLARTYKKLETLSEEEREGFRKDVELFITSKYLSATRDYLTDKQFNGQYSSMFEEVQGQQVFRFKFGAK